MQNEMEAYNKKYAVDLSVLNSSIFYSNDSIVITDTKLDSPGPHILYVNPAFSRMTGYKPEEVIGRNPRLLQGKKTDPAVLQRLRRSLEAGEPFFGSAVNYRKDGSEFYNEWHIEPIKNKSGKITHFLAVQRDITERKMMEESLERKNIALTEVIESVQTEKEKLKKEFSSVIRDEVLPLISKAKVSKKQAEKYLKLLESNLEGLLTKLPGKSYEGDELLSSREREIAKLVRDGLSNKDIAEMLNLSVKTIETHRNRIRKKLGLIRKGTSLSSFLSN